MSSKSIKVTDFDSAMVVAEAITGIHDFDLCVEKSERAGYDIFVSECDPRYYICNLKERLEVNLSDGKSVNVWIGNPQAEGLQRDIEKISIDRDGYKDDCNRLTEAIQKYQERIEEYENQICKLKAKLYDYMVAEKEMEK